MPHIWDLCDWRKCTQGVQCSHKHRLWFRQDCYLHTHNSQGLTRHDSQSDIRHTLSHASSCFPNTCLIVERPVTAFSIMSKHFMTGMSRGIKNPFSMIANNKKSWKRNGALPASTIAYIKTCHTHFVCLPRQTHPVQVVQSLLTSWWVESGVSDKGDIKCAGKGCL